MKAERQTLERSDKKHDEWPVFCLTVNPRSKASAGGGDTVGTEYGLAHRDCGHCSQSGIGVCGKWRESCDNIEEHDDDDEWVEFRHVPKEFFSHAHRSRLAWFISSKLPDHQHRNHHHRCVMTRRQLPTESQALFQNKAGITLIFIHFLDHTKRLFGVICLRLSAAT